MGERIDSLDIRKAARLLLEDVGASWLPREVGSMLEASDRRLFVACSGGADSVFLLLWTWAYLETLHESRDEATVLHFNHALRGESSDGDERFVASLCDRLGVACKRGDWERADDAVVSEATARAARLEFFEREVGEVDSALVLTGHHADDVVESILMRLSRGAGAAGLSSPKPISDAGHGYCVARPLIGLRRDFIRESLSRHGVEWREDDTNAGDAFYRNRVRNRVLPAWQAAADRDLVAGVGLSRRLLQEDAEALEHWLDREWATLSPQGGELDLYRLRQLPRALQRRALQRLVVVGGCSFLVPANIDELLWAAVSEESHRTSVGDATWVEVQPEENRVVLHGLPTNAGWRAFRLPIGVCAYLPRLGCVSAKVLELSDELRLNVLAGQVPSSRIVVLACREKHFSSIIVRRWQEGDAYAPIGLSNSKKLSRLFADRKISLKRRRILPLFVDSSGNVLWSPGLPPNKSYQIDATATHALQLTYEA